MVQIDIKAIGKRIKFFIKSKNLTQEQFARLLKYEPSTLRRWLAYGLRDVETIQLIANCLNVNVKEIIFG